MLCMLFHLSNNQKNENIEKEEREFCDVVTTLL